ncbi:MAG: hypothetical protein JWL59_1144 [Chthoniobacteraceae bacterium]|nr:hypothetical protein [Chthoniobacteraceae bacterium]
MPNQKAAAPGARSLARSGVHKGLESRASLLDRVRLEGSKFVHVAGVPYSAQRELQRDRNKVDHVLITLAAGEFGQLAAAVNTFSWLNGNAGFDPRVRLGVVASTWSETPPVGIEETSGFDYAEIEAREQVEFLFQDQELLAARLIAKTRAAVRIELWGELYARRTIGIHQIHSRRASNAMPMEVRNRDGALKFYYREQNAAELFLFKFDGQI